MRAAMLLAPALAMTTQVLAQDVGGDVAAGRRIADQWCSACHQIDALSSGGLAPTFPKVANLPSTTALSLKVFLRTSHQKMPNIQLTRSEADAVVAYILSLKGK
jgi:mono/diheme cytochrome c family protein